MPADKAKILIITFNIPYPAIDGGKIYIFGSIEYLRAFYDITLVLKAYSNEDLRNIEELSKKWPDVKLEVVSYIIPLTKPSIQARTYVSITSKLRAIKNKLLHADENKDSKKTLDTSILNDFTLVDEKFINALGRLFKTNSYNIVQVEYIRNISLVNILPEGAIKVFVEIESRNSIVYDYLKIFPHEDIYTEYVVKNTEHLEFSFMNKYDVIFSLSKSDFDRISNQLPGKQVVLSPYCVLDEHLRDISGLPCKIEKLVFMGSEGHPPNKDAVEWFIKSIFPAILNTKPIPLYITGNWSDSFKASRLRENVFFTGIVDDLDELLQNSILIVPIRIGGGGIRAKVLQSMAFGIPIVSTSLGCDGVGGKDNEHYLIADNENEFADAVVRLLNDSVLAKKLVTSSRKLIDEKFTMKKTGEVRRNIYNGLLNEKALDRL